MRRATVVFAVAAALVLAGVTQRPQAAALGMTQVTINCTDGTSVTVVADADMLTGLVSAVQGMVDYPAGLNCTLIQVPLLTWFGHVTVAANPNTLIVAGGRWLAPCSVIGVGFGTSLPAGTVASRGSRPMSAMLLPAPLASGSTPCDDDLQFGCIWVNIGANVHYNGQNVLEGSINETIPENQSCPNIVDSNTGQPIPLGPSHFDSKPTPTSCLFVSGKVTATTAATALTTTYVTHVFGFTFVNIAGLSENPSSPVHSQFVDVGNPSTFTDKFRDALNAPPLPPNSDCEGRTSITTGNVLLQHGNINVYGAS